MTYVKFNHPANRSINNFLDSFINEFPVATGNFSPAVNINEHNDAYDVSFMAPGRKKEDFKITVDKNILTVSYDKKEETADEDIKKIKREFSLESFQRSFSLDEKIQADNIKATYENGILRIALPKKEELIIQPKEIAIQ